MPAMHTRFSRWMAPIPVTRTSVAGWLILAVLVAASLFLLVAYPFATVFIIGALILVTVIAERNRAARVSEDDGCHVAVRTPRVGAGPPPPRPDSRGV